MHDKVCVTHPGVESPMRLLDTQWSKTLEVKMNGFGVDSSPGRHCKVEIFRYQTSRYQNIQMSWIIHKLSSHLSKYHSSITKISLNPIFLWVVSVLFLWYSCNIIELNYFLYSNSVSYTIIVYILYFCPTPFCPNLKNFGPPPHDSF